MFPGISGFQIVKENHFLVGAYFCAYKNFMLIRKMKNNLCLWFKVMHNINIKKLEKQYIVNLNYMFNFMLLCKNYMVILVNFVFIELQLLNYSCSGYMRNNVYFFLGCYGSLLIIYFFIGDRVESLWVVLDFWGSSLINSWVAVDIF